ncbi:SUMF1/EgtB/PvdOfamily nonheme iron enzyme [Listeria monocytogenes]|nr:SUMF1/EgtB/PvdOfamily nonheme iron enzyme [Listeria monocytogenes]
MKKASKYRDLATYGLKKIGRKFIHEYSGIEFIHVKGGVFQMGFSEAEEVQARNLASELYMTPSEMRPIHQENIPDLLVATHPLSNIIVSKLINHSFESELADYPAFVPFSQAEEIALMINARLPFEKEWEYFCRAGSRDLFTFGKEVPDEHEMEKWLNPNLSDIENSKSNNWGLYHLFNSEWCTDLYKPDYDVNSNVTNDHVIRGGGAYFWPWQDDEWVWCASAMRYPSSDLEEQVSCIRPVIPLGDLKSN